MSREELEEAATLYERAPRPRAPVESEPDATVNRPLSRPPAVGDLIAEKYRLMRTLGFNRLSERIVARLDPHTRGALERRAGRARQHVGSGTGVQPFQARSQKRERSVRRRLGPCVDQVPIGRRRRADGLGDDV